MRRRRRTHPRISNSLGQIPAWVAGALIIYLVWPDSFTRDGFYVEIPLLGWSILFGQNFLKALFPKAPQRDWQVYVGAVAAFAGIISGLGLAAWLGLTWEGYPSIAVACTIIGFVLGACSRWISFLLPQEPFAKWGD